MLDGFEETNVRGLIDIADRIATKVASGVTQEAAVDEIFRDRYTCGPRQAKIRAWALQTGLRRR